MNKNKGDYIMDDEELEVTKVALRDLLDKLSNASITCKFLGKRNKNLQLINKKVVVIANLLAKMNW